MSIGYTVDHKTQQWTAYVLETPNIKGTGKDRCEALEDLIRKYRAILTTVQELQKGCKP
jgi:hypothetical protein